LVNAMRNTYLYPVPDGLGGYVAPDALYTPANANDLIARVGRVANLVKREL
jgi:hypothetical protein